MDPAQAIPAARDLILERLNLTGAPVHDAIVTGSGLGALARLGQPLAELPYAEIPGIGQAGVAGHAGRLVLLQTEWGRLLCCIGRRHLYEGIDPALTGRMPRILAALGLRRLWLTNAAGGLSPRLHPGDLMLITDHINLMMRNPLIGPHDPADGPRFPDLSNIYDSELRVRLQAVARAEAIDLKSGVYVGLTGPTYESRAEVRMLRRLGADAVGMSTVPEALAAAPAGLRVAAISLITNSHVHPAPPPTHDEVLAMAAHGADRLRRLLAGAIPSSAES